MKPIQKLSRELPFLKEIENLKTEVDSHKPISKDVQAKILQKSRLDWNYNTNAIEGNSYTRGETITLLMEGYTASNKPLRYGKEIEWHNKAIDIVMSLIKDDRNLNESDIRSLHEVILGEDYYSAAVTKEGKPTRKLIQPGKYKTSSNHVETQTGEIHYYASVEETPIKMKELMDWYNEASGLKEVNPIVLSAIFHHKFVAIHPFDDGNGRMTRLLTNFILLKFGYPISVIKQEKRNKYYAALSKADQGEIIPFIELIADTVKDGLEVYLKAIQGKDIQESEDLDKEIDLLLKKYSRENLIKDEKNANSIKSIFDGFLINFINKLTNKTSKFDILFYSNEKILSSSNDNYNLNKKLVLAKAKYQESDHTFYFISTEDKYNNNEFTHDDIFGERGLNISNINNFEINYNWSNFLKNNQQNSIQLRINFSLNKFKYEINIQGKNIFSAYYHEIPSEKEADNLVSLIVRENLIKVIESWD